MRGNATQFARLNTSSNCGRLREWEGRREWSVTHPETHWMEAGRARLARARSPRGSRSSARPDRADPSLFCCTHRSTRTDPTWPRPRLTGCSHRRDHGGGDGRKDVDGRERTQSGVGRSTRERENWRSTRAGGQACAGAGARGAVILRSRMMVFLWFRLREGGREGGNEGAEHTACLLGRSLARSSKIVPSLARSLTHDSATLPTNEPASSPPLSLP